MERWWLCFRSEQTVDQRSKKNGVHAAKFWYSFCYRLVANSLLVLLLTDTKVADVVNMLQTMGGLFVNCVTSSPRRHVHTHSENIPDICQKSGPTDLSDGVMTP